MKLPRCNARPFSTRIFGIITAGICVAMLSLPAPAAAQQLTCSPSSIQFGDVPIGQSERQTLVLTNGGQTSVNVSAMNSSTGVFSLSGAAIPSNLAAGQSVALSVTFSPIAAGYVGGHAIFTSSALNPSLQVSVQGTGVKKDALAVSPSAVGFGNVALGGKSTLSVVLTNMRSYGVKLSGIQTTGSGFSLVGPALPMTLKAGQSVSLQLTFAPQLAGPVGGSVFITGPAIAIPLTGAGTSTTTAGQLNISPSALSFGSVPVGTTQTQAVTMSAAGSSVTVSSDASSSSQFVLNGATLPFTIPAGQSVSFNVAFTPKTSGTLSGSLSFTSNASDSQLVESLSGAGTVTQHTVGLFWNAVTGVAGYNVYRSSSANGTYVKINSGVDPNTAYTDSNVVSGQTYFYSATSVDSAGTESVRSNPPVEAAIP